MPMKICKYCGMKYYERKTGEPCTYCNNVGGRSYNEMGKTTNEIVTDVILGAGNDDSWEVKIDTVHDCSKAPTKITVKIDLEAKLKIDSLMEKYPSMEWLAYLIGQAEDKEKEIEADPLHVVDIHIPEQEVTSVKVDEIECPEFNSLNIVGVIHSHHGMGTGFSGTDHEYINGNHNLSLVIAKNGVAGQYRFETPCGALKIISEVKVKVIYPDFGFNKDEWLEKETKKIKKWSAPVTAYGVYTPGAGGWSRGGLNHSQQQYSGAGSIKKTDDAWETNPDDMPTFDENQSLKDALNEAFDD